MGNGRNFRFSRSTRFQIRLAAHVLRARPRPVTVLDMKISGLTLRRPLLGRRCGRMSPAATEIASDWYGAPVLPASSCAVNPLAKPRRAGRWSRVTRRPCCLVRLIAHRTAPAASGARSCPEPFGTGALPRWLSFGGMEEVKHGWVRLGLGCASRRAGLAARAPPVADQVAVKGPTGRTPGESRPLWPWR